MKKILLLSSAIIFSLQLIAQPYVDPLNIRYTKAFESKSPSGTPFQYLYVGSDMPLRLNSGKLIVISPNFESWNIDSSGNKTFLPTVSSIALPVIAQLPLAKDKWTIQIGVIPRYNSENLKLSGNAFQIGGIVVANYIKKPTLKYRFGVYMNKEFFGTFIIPLAGIDWKINDRNYLFGLLPGRLSYEHKLSDQFYCGGNFRFITNSYLLANNNYLRIDDNQLSAYLDFYPAKRIVLTGEAGYGIFRKLRSGNGANKNYITDYNWNDGLFVKLNASYRIRL